MNILSQVGYRLIGDIAGHKENELYKKAEKARKENNSILAEKYEKEAKKWSESGSNRIAMHGIMGVLVSKEAGTGMTKGLTGAGLNALLQKEPGKIKDKEVHKIASAAIGYLAGGKTGAAIAHQATTFNYLIHEQYKQYLDDMKNAKPWRKLMCNTYFSTIITLACGFVLTKIGYQTIWPLFGSANQLLSALVLITLCVFLKVTGRSNKMLFPPMIIMLCVTFTALVQRVIGLIKSLSAGQDIFASVIQLVVAVLLIVLALIIVVNSFKSYAKSKKNSETETKEVAE